MKTIVNTTLYPTVDATNPTPRIVTMYVNPDFNPAQPEDPKTNNPYLYESISIADLEVQNPAAFAAYTTLIAELSAE